MAEQKGGCFCGKIRMSFNGEPDAHVSPITIQLSRVVLIQSQVLCHCLDCRKIGGAAFSNNIIVDDSRFKLEAGM